MESELIDRGVDLWLVAGCRVASRLVDGSCVNLRLIGKGDLQLVYGGVVESSGCEVELQLMG